MLYHYTDRLSAADIISDGVILARPQTLHRDMFARDKGLTTTPIVWLSTESDGDGTVAAKMIASEWPPGLIGDLCRFSVADTHPCQTLDEYILTIGMDPIWWKWVVLTGRLAGSDWNTWRLCVADIRSADWLAVDVLTRQGWRTFQERTGQ